jgi:hypothetical protein
MKYKELSKNIDGLRNSTQIRTSIDDIISEFLDEVKTQNPEKYDCIMEDLSAAIMGPHFTEDTCKKAVMSMRNVDGSTGEHWDMEQTTQAANQVGIQFSEFNVYDWYYVLNMMWSDYSNIFDDDNSTYISLAKAWLTDPDMPEGKAWRYYKCVVKA